MCFQTDEAIMSQELLYFNNFYILAESQNFFLFLGIKVWIVAHFVEKKILILRTFVKKWVEQCTSCEIKPGTAIIQNFIEHKLTLFWNIETASNMILLYVFSGIQINSSFQLEITVLCLHDLYTAFQIVFKNNYKK